jgi:predicted nuclease with TOPRIM domain
MNDEHLEAEVERLEAHCQRMASDLVDIADDHSRLFYENARLKAEVERLTKAGDGLYKSMLEIGCNEMADNFQYDAWWGSMNAWNAAKEGKTQP